VLAWARHRLTGTSLAGDELIGDALAQVVAALADTGAVEALSVGDTGTAIVPTVPTGRATVPTRDLCNTVARRRRQI
jgi:hypothetical protein